MTVNETMNELSARLGAYYTAALGSTRLGTVRRSALLPQVAGRCGPLLDQFGLWTVLYVAWRGLVRRSMGLRVDQGDGGRGGGRHPDLVQA